MCTDGDNRVVGALIVFKFEYLVANAAEQSDRSSPEAKNESQHLTFSHESPGGKMKNEK